VRRERGNPRSDDKAVVGKMFDRLLLLSSKAEACFSSVTTAITLIGTLKTTWSTSFYAKRCKREWKREREREINRERERRRCEIQNSKQTMYDTQTTPEIHAHT
jgi:hypothetical protein